MLTTGKAKSVRGVKCWLRGFYPGLSQLATLSLELSQAKGFPVSWSGAPKPPPFSVLLPSQ